MVTVGPLTVHERIVIELPNTHHSYSIQTVIPVRDHRADAWFAVQGEGTRLRFTTAFVPKIPGTGSALRAGLRFGIRRLARSLVTAAEASNAVCMDLD
jgi:hypothetical protein